MNREQWLKLPVNERAKQTATVTPAEYDKYIAVVMRLKRRFYRCGCLVIEVGGKPAPYRVLEDMAWMKYIVNRKAA